MAAEIEISTMHEIGYTIGLFVVMAISAWSGWHSKRAKQASDEINDAVNHRHTRKTKDGNTPPKLYDAVLHLHARTDHIDEKADELIGWKRTYDGGPLDNGTKVTEFVGKVDQLSKKLDEVEIGCKKQPCKQCGHKPSEVSDE